MCVLTMRMYTRKQHQQQKAAADAAAAAAAAAESPRPRDKYERFEHWLRENGAKFDQVRTAVRYNTST